MRDIIIFTVQSNYYALGIDKIQRIIHTPSVTVIPDAHSCIDGMISYEDRVIKVINFRKIVAFSTFEDELKELFETFKTDHKTWMEMLSQAIIDKTSFPEEVDPHQCAFGQWLAGYNAYDDNIAKILGGLKGLHSSFHKQAEEIITLSKSDEYGAITMLQDEMYTLYGKIITQIDELIRISDAIAASLQKLLIYQVEEELFAIKVDDIEDIIAIDDRILQSIESDERLGDFLTIEGVVERDHKLINVINSVTLPMNEGK